MKKWQTFGDECPKCGSPAEVYTSAQDGYAYDGDNAQCVECGHGGSVSCDGDKMMMAILQHGYHGMILMRMMSYEKNLNPPPLIAASCGVGAKERYDSRNNDK